jgi:hypothetical protein
MENKEYFGFICKEYVTAGAGSGGVPGGYVAYVFRCQSDSVSGDILKGKTKVWLVRQEISL